MSFKENQNQSGYDLWSSSYDRYPNPTVAADELSFLSFYSHLSGKNVLEVGPGTGRHTLRLLLAENSVTGVDLSQGMLNQLKEKIQSPRLTLVQGDFLTVDVPNGPFDVLLSSLVLEHIPDLLTFFRRARELLKSGGEVFISDLHPQRTGAGVFAHFKDELGREVALESYAHRENEIRQSAEENGFVIKSSDSVLGSDELVKFNQKWERYLGLPMIQIWSMVAK